MGIEQIDSFQKRQWQKLEQSHFAEAFQPQCSQGNAPFDCAHTGRQYSNSTVNALAFAQRANENSKDVSEPFVFRFSDGSKLIIPPINGYVEQRWNSARADAAEFLAAQQ